MNDLGLNGKEDTLVTIDDTGDIRLWDTNTGKGIKRIRSVHDNLGMVVGFRPGFTQEIASGGMDSRVVRTDTSRGRPLGRYDIQRPEDEGAAQILNPPFVYSMLWEPSGRGLVVGCGDGLLRSYHPPAGPFPKTSGRVKRDWTQRIWQTQGSHLSAVSALGIDKTEPSMIYSGGNDGTIHKWDIAQGISLGTWKVKPIVKINALAISPSTDPSLDPMIWVSGTTGDNVKDKGIICGTCLR